jgi:hypothetical protein
VKRFELPHSVRVIPRNFKPWPNKPGIFVTQIKPQERS